MFRSDFADLLPEQLVNVATLADGYKNPRSRAETDALRELIGIAAATTCLLAPWVFVERRTAAGKVWPGGSFAWVRSTVDVEVELMIHREDLRHYTSPEKAAEIAAKNRQLSERLAARRLHVVPAAEPTTVSTTASAGNVALAFTPSPAPWADNVRVGAVYLDVDPDGGVCCAVVRGKPGKAVITLRAGSIEDFEALGPAITRHLTDLLRKKLACSET